MSGIAVGAWIKIGDCPIEYKVFEDEAEFQIGGRSDGVYMIATEVGLANLISNCTEALEAIRAGNEEPE